VRSGARAHNRRLDYASQIPTLAAPFVRAQVDRDKLVFA
jgi:hypothetical protein